jgi:hypothetical protein
MHVTINYTSCLQSFCMQVEPPQADVAAASAPAAASDAVAAAAAGAVPGSETQVTASQLQLTQLVGSAGDQQVLLNQPKASIIARARLPRGDRLVSFHSRPVAWRAYCTATVCLSSNRVALALKYASATPAVIVQALFVCCTPVCTASCTVPSTAVNTGNARQCCNLSFSIWHTQ